MRMRMRVRVRARARVRARVRVRVRVHVRARARCACAFGGLVRPRARAWSSSKMERRSGAQTMSEMVPENLNFSSHTGSTVFGTVRDLQPQGTSRTRKDSRGKKRVQRRAKRALASNTAQPWTVSLSNWPVVCPYSVSRVQWLIASPEPESPT
eukprot:6190807-Pleurochrysis_carterae.AAC.1